MDVKFTTKIEKQLDEIAEGLVGYNPVLSKFYTPFTKDLGNAETAPRIDRALLDEETEFVCEKCERPMVIKTGRFGRFLACSGFPDCRNSKQLTLGVECPEDGGEIVERRQRKKGGRKFYGCANYPNCNFVVNDKPLSQKCPECAGLLVESGRDRARCMECTYRGSIQQNEEVAVA